MSALILHLAAEEAAVVEEVTDEGRRVVAVTEGGERFEFRLRRSTARYHSRGAGPRLRLLP